MSLLKDPRTLIFRAVLIIVLAGQIAAIVSQVG